MALCCATTAPATNECHGRRPTPDAEHAPQDLALTVASKAIAMFQKLNVPILGVVENMSYYPCPDTGKLHLIFGPSHAAELAKEVNTALSVQLPIDPQIAELGDIGKIEDFRQPELNVILDVI